MQKEIDISKIKADPILDSRLKSDSETTVITGHAISVSKDIIKFCESLSDSTYLEIGTASIVAAFNDDDTNLVTLVVKSNADIRQIAHIRASSAMFKRQSEGGPCGTKFASSDGRASCCCGVGQRCVAGSSTCNCEDATKPSPSGFDAGALTGNMQQAFDNGSDYTGLAGSVMAARRPSFGFGGGFGGLGPTLPTCSYVKKWIPCGSPLPGYPTPMCEDWVYCCRWPNGAEGCM